MPAIPAPALIRATPAMWEIRDADTTIYLFGTFHTLDQRTVWFGDKVRAAFDESGELVLETVVPEDRAKVQAAAQAEVTEVSADGSRRLKPFMAQTQTAISQGRTLGLSVDNGADAVLRRVAENVGKPVAGSSGSRNSSIRWPAFPPAPSPGSRKAAAAATITLNDLLGAWTKGDTGAFSTMLAGFEAKSPVAYRMLIADRNARWGQWIADRHASSRASSSSRSARAISPARTASSIWLAARGITATRVS